MLKEDTIYRPSNSLPWTYVCHPSLRLWVYIRLPLVKARRVRESMFATCTCEGGKSWRVYVCHLWRREKQYWETTDQRMGEEVCRWGMTNSWGSDEIRGVRKRNEQRKFVASNIRLVSMLMCSLRHLLKSDSISWWNLRCSNSWMVRTGA